MSYLTQLGSNLYNNSNNLNWDTLGTTTGINIATDIFNGVASGLTNYFQQKSNYYLQATQLLNQSIPLYQQIGAQVRQQMNHTQQQGEMKLNEIKNNVNTNLNNMKSIATTQATMSLMSNIFSGINSGINRGFDFMNSAAKAGAFSQNSQKNNNNNINTNSSSKK